MEHSRSIQSYRNTKLLLISSFFAKWCSSLNFIMQKSSRSSSKYLTFFCRDIGAGYEPKHKMTVFSHYALIFSKIPSSGGAYWQKSILCQILLIQWQFWSNYAHFCKILIFSCSQNRAVKKKTCPWHDILSWLFFGKIYF